MLELFPGGIDDMPDDQVFVEINADVACHVVYSLMSEDQGPEALSNCGSAERRTALDGLRGRTKVQAEWRNEGLTGNYLFELEAHPGWPQGRSVRMTGSQPICQSSGPDAAGLGLAHSFLMAQSPTLRRPRRPVPGTSSGTHALTRWQSEIERRRQSLSCQVE
jgi:hypothetical protein